jgi:hypothetical protein
MNKLTRTNCEPVAFKCVNQLGKAIPKEIILPLENGETNHVPFLSVPSRF